MSDNLEEIWWILLSLHNVLFNISLLVLKLISLLTLHNFILTWFSATQKQNICKVINFFFLTKLKNFKTKEKAYLNFNPWKN